MIREVPEIWMGTNNTHILCFLQVTEGNSVTISDSTLVYSVTNPICLLPDSPHDATSTNTADWIRTLTSLTSTILSCNDGYHLAGSADVSCDEHGMF